MPFNRHEVDELLTACHRRCCICHRFCGVKMETDHIVPQADGGPDEIDNAIPVCFECHAEIHSYNDQHPRGRKFRPEELQKHKEQWLEICRNRPEAFINASRNADVGPLQALIDELEFNATVARLQNHEMQGCLFLDDQFRRAIREGSIATLRDDLKGLILSAYVAIGRANQQISGVMIHAPRGNAWAEAVNRASAGIGHAKNAIAPAKDALLKFLRSDP
ncbi:MAG: HNH endonuclease [Acidobacteriota bacterium]